MVNLTLSLSEEQAWQLGQMCKRFTFLDAQQMSVFDVEAYLMLEAINIVRKALAEEGVAPR
jgi:hypothetical protein